MVSKLKSLTAAVLLSYASLRAEEPMPDYSIPPLDPYDERSWLLDRNEFKHPFILDDPKPALRIAIATDCPEIETLDKVYHRVESPEDLVKVIKEFQRPNHPISYFWVVSPRKRTEDGYCILHERAFVLYKGFNVDTEKGLKYLKSVFKQ